MVVIFDWKENIPGLCLDFKKSLHVYLGAFTDYLNSWADDRCQLKPARSPLVS